MAEHPWCHSLWGIVGATLTNGASFESHTMGQPWSLPAIDGASPHSRTWLGHPPSLRFCHSWACSNFRRLYLRLDAIFLLSNLSTGDAWPSSVVSMYNANTFHRIPLTGRPFNSKKRCPRFLLIAAVGDGHGLLEPFLSIPLWTNQNHAHLVILSFLHNLRQLAEIGVCPNDTVFGK